MNKNNFPSDAFDDRIEKILKNLDQLIAVLPDVDRAPLAENLFRLRSQITDQECLLKEYRQALEKTSQPPAKNGYSPYQQAGEIIESITDAVYAVDATWRLTYVNQHAALLFRQSREKLIGTLLWDLFPHHKRSESYPVVQYAMQERTPVHYETYSMTLGIWVEAHVYPTSDGGLVTYLRDITDRKKAEILRQESENKFKAILNNAPFGIVLARLEDGLIVDVNPAWLKLFEFSREEVIGRTFLDIDVIIDPQSRMSGLEMIRSKGRLWHFQVMVQTKSHQKALLSVNADRITIDGEEYYLLITENITGQKHSQ